MITWSLSGDWDCFVDSKTKGIALKEGNDQIAQDVSSSIRVFSGELVFDTERGIAYNKPEEIVGSLNFEMIEQAKRIEGVANASVVFNNIENRNLDVSIYVVTNDGETIEVE